jgi:hypothetical protein
MNLLRKQVPAFVMLIVVVLAGLIGAVIASVATSTITTRSVTNIGGEVFTLTGDLAISSYSTSPSTTTYSVATSSIGASGTIDSPVVMTNPGSTANTAITQGDFVYTVTVTVVHDVETTTTYDVTLKVDGEVNGNVYIQQLSSPPTQVGDSVSISWDLGITLESHVFEIDIVPT